MKIGLAQINPLVGDVSGNTERILAQVRRAREAGCGLVVFPELAVFGYPPRDLLLRRRLVDRNRAAMERIAAQCEGICAVVGFVERDTTGSGPGLLNAAAFCRHGCIEEVYAKALLPNYDVFDERRYFNAGNRTCVVSLGGDGSSGDGQVVVALTVCEDLWNDQQFDGRQMYGRDPIAEAAAAGAQWVINVSASPFEMGKHAIRLRLFGEQAREHGVGLVWVNQVGGNDDLLFDGASLMMDCEGRVLAQALAFEETLLVYDLSGAGGGSVAPYPEPLESVRRALVTGTRDYVHKCGFRDVVIGLSGGVDSAVTCVLAVEALGAEHVHGLAMPSRFSSTHSLEDATELARNLGIDFRVVPIAAAHDAVEQTLAPHFAGRAPDVTEENLQSRIRGGLLMALSNKFGWLPLTTGNKSELGVGYCTLYGDMCGGLAVISDLPKTSVYALAQHLNRDAAAPRIPLRTLSKPPSAELRPDQTDQDTLPPYPLLDAILERYIEKDMCAEDIIAQGYDEAVVRRVAWMVDTSEYKRRQAALGLKVTTRAFGTGRRVPIAARVC